MDGYQYDKSKKSGRTFKEVGKRWYDFDFQLEKAIYDYLCCNHVKKKMLRKLGADLRFESYRQWKWYVSNKYGNYGKDMLNEFSRFLNQEIRDIKPSHEHWSIMATVLMTVIFTNIMDMFLNLKIDFNGIPLWGRLIMIMVLEIVVVLFLLLLFSQTMTPIINNNAEESFLKDYKEIIDDIINEKEKHHT